MDRNYPNKHHNYSPGMVPRFWSYLPRLIFIAHDYWNTGRLNLVMAAHLEGIAFISPTSGLVLVVFAA